ncbi:MAG: putative ABC transporter permease [Oscillospiraceae bacterium]|nr:putative ABC transporter permease [Oscillospiraceae bacterium]
MARWFLYFMFYSFTGYLLEKLFAWVTQSPNQVRKCFLLLPLCPVYGLAMTVVLALVPAGTGLLPSIVLDGVICTAVEYLAHLFYEKALRVHFWDYSQLRGHVRGRICPQFALIWGVLSAAAVRLVQPLAAWLAARTPPAAAYALWLLLAADCVLTTALLRRSRDPEQLALGTALAQVWASSQSSTSL